MKSNVCKIENGTRDLTAILVESERVIEIGAIFVYGFRVVCDKAVLLLTEDLVKNGHGNSAAVNKLAEYVSRAYALKLINVTYQDNLCSRSYTGEKVIGKPHIDHRTLVHDNEIRIKRFFLFIPDVATVTKKS